jgi:hypothetical protein
MGNASALECMGRIEHMGDPKQMKALMKSTFFATYHLCVEGGRGGEGETKRNFRKNRLCFVFT